MTVLLNRWKKESLFKLGGEKWRIEKSSNQTILIHHIKMSAFQNLRQILDKFFNLNFDIKVTVNTKTLTENFDITYIDKKILNEIVFKENSRIVTKKLLTPIKKTHRVSQNAFNLKNSNPKSEIDRCN